MYTTKFYVSRIATVSLAKHAYFCLQAVSIGPEYQANIPDIQEFSRGMY